MKFSIAAAGIALLLLGSPKPAERLGKERLGKQYILVVGLLCVVASLVWLAPSMVLAGLMVAGSAGLVLRRVRARRRNAEIAAATSTYIGFVLGDLRAGSAMPHALNSAAGALKQRENIPQVLIDAAHIAARRAQSGAPAAGTFIDIKETCPDLGTIGLVWGVAEQHGIPLVELLEQTQRRIDTRLRHRAATTAALQGPQATAVILAILPIAGLLLGSGMGADPVGYLLHTSLGGILMTTGVGLTCAGFLWSQTILERAAL